PWFQIGGTPRVARKQIHRRIEADLAKRAGDGGVLGPPELGLDPGQIDFRWLDLTEEHHVVPGAVVRVAEDHAVRKDLEKRRNLALHRLDIALIELDEQRHRAAGIEMR